jgi:hypothetical protein
MPRFFVPGLDKFRLGGVAMFGLRCIVYRSAGRICGRPATAFSPRLGGWACAECQRRWSAAPATWGNWPDCRPPSEDERDRARRRGLTGAGVVAIPAVPGPDNAPLSEMGQDLS